MEATLRIASQVLAFGDTPPNSNPRRRHVDWEVDLPSLRVRNPLSDSRTLQPGEGPVTFFDGTRALAVDASTTFSVGLLSGTPDRYRLTHTGGTAPGFRTDRALDLSGATVTVTVNADRTATFVTAGGTDDFTGTQEGDILWVPDVAQAPAQPFHEGNQGFWTVLAATASTIVAARDGDFEALGEAVTLTDGGQLVVFSRAGVQAGDSLDLLAGFASASLRSYRVLAATPVYLEIQSALPVPAQTGIQPDAAGIAAHSFSKRFVHVVAEQECVVRVNDDDGATQRVVPWVPGDPDQPGWYTRTGPTWKLTVENKGTAPLDVLVASCE